MLSLSAIQDLEDLIARADKLWPAYPENVAKYEDWLRDARALIDGRPADEAQGIKAKPSLAEHKRKLAELEQRALRPADEEKGADHREWNFADTEDRWWHVQLTKLIANLEAFADPTTGLFSSGISKEHGWGIEKRATFARTIDEQSVSGPDAAKRWAEAIGSIRDVKQCPKYEGLVLTPQLGLLPIGRDKDSGLWEFAHLQTGDAAERGDDAKLLLKESMGIVLVLIPGGTFKMGAQSTDPTEANYDPQAARNESPVHEVTLEPYFLSKYEMTQAQWERFVGSNPSYYRAGNRSAKTSITSLHPVEQVSWEDCTETLQRLGLSLPTEAQWEKGCRAGTTSAWHSGDSVESLAGYANIADEGSAYAFAKGWSFEAGFKDGFDVHAPVGSFLPNAFGLHDMHGNVWEWCRDGYGGYDLSVRAGDGERQVIGPRDRVNRGGSFYDTAVNARSAARTTYTPEIRYYDLGARPTRGITP